MGGSSSKPTVLDGMIKKFKKGFVRDYGVKMSPRELCNLCELDWPSFDVGRPSEGTLNLPTVQTVHQVVTGTPGHPDQFPHRGLASNSTDPSPIGKILDERTGTE